MSFPGRHYLNTALLLAVAGAIAGALMGGPWLALHYLCKPLATVLLLWLAASPQAPVSRRYRNAVVAGMAFSLAGDVCLMLPVDLFLPGLVAFLLAHVCYMVAFYPGADLRLRLSSIALFAVFGIANLAGLLPRLETTMRAPVLVYVAALVVMAGFALARARAAAAQAPAAPLRKSTRFAAWGAGLFVLSDTVLAWDRFGGGIGGAPLWVLSTYYLAQWLIARSVARQA